jgi:hypothetical protein
VRLPDNVSIMNRAATEDVRSPVWPVVSDVLRTGPAPSARAQEVVDVLDDWVARDAPRLDADLDGFNDDAGPGIMDAVFRPITDAVMAPVFGDLLDDLSDVRGLGGQSGHSYVDKDLRTLLNRRVRGKFNLRYCGHGSLRACRAALWAVVQRVGNELAFAQASEGRQATADWRFPASRTGFQPGLIPNTMRSTNRPTFQQVIEFQHP